MNKSATFLLAVTLLCGGSASAQPSPKGTQATERTIPAPQRLSVAPTSGELGQHELHLVWDPVPGASGYEVFQRRQGKWWLNEEDPTCTPLTTSTTISGLDSNADYEFCVRAVGEAGKNSVYSIPSGGRTAAPGVAVAPSNIQRPSFRKPAGVSLEPPSGIIGLYSEADRIRLSWRPVLGAVRYTIEQEKNGVWSPAEKVVGDVAATSVTLVDRPSPGPYRLRVRAVNREGTLSDPSWPISVEH